MSGNRGWTYRDHRDDGCAQPTALFLVLVGLLVALIRRAAS